MTLILVCIIPAESIILTVSTCVLKDIALLALWDTVTYFGRHMVVWISQPHERMLWKGADANNYASASSGEAFRDRQLTPNFELWVEIFCVPTCFHMRILKPCLSVCLSVPREKKSPSKLRQYQSYISNWYINGKVFTSTTPWKPKNLNFFRKIRILALNEELKSP